MDSDMPEQILRQAAAAAAAILPSLEEERAKLLKELHHIEFQVTQMRTLLTACPSVYAEIGAEKAPESSINLPDAAGSDVSPAAAKKAPKGQLEERIKEVLSPLVPTSARDIKERLDEKFDGDANRSSIHQTLHRGLKAGTFTCANNLWVLNK